MVHFQIFIARSRGAIRVPAHVAGSHSAEDFSPPRAVGEVPAYPAGAIHVAHNAAGASSNNRRAVGVIDQVKESHVTSKSHSTSVAKPPASFTNPGCIAALEISAIASEAGHRCLVHRPGLHRTCEIARPYEITGALYESAPTWANTLFAKVIQIAKFCVRGTG